MRRITIYTDEDSARKAAAWLEQQGLDYMSEDYAGPAITRRAEPVRQSEPERHEGGASLLLRQQPRQQPKGPGQK